MGVITLTDPVAGTLADATVIANNNANIKAAINGGIDNNNFAAGRIFDPAKLMQNAALDGDPLVWDNTLVKWVPASTLAAGRPRPTRVVVSTWTGGPPASPVDGDIWIATVTFSGTPFRWQFIYDSSQPTYKWVFIGGGFVGANNGAAYTNTIAGSYQIPGTFAFTASRAGIYVGYTQAEFSNGSGVAVEAAVSLSVNGVAGIGVGADNQAIPNGQSVTMNTMSDTGAVAAGQVIDVGYFSSSIAGTHNFLNRSFWLVPKQVI